MKNLKKILALALCLMMAMVLLTSCGGSIEGEWELDDIKGADVDDEMKMFKEIGASITMKFEDGEVTMTVSLMGQSQSEHGEYEIDGNKISIDGDEFVEFKVSGNKLTIENGEGGKLIFKRK